MTLETFYDGLFARAEGKGSFAFNGWGSRRSQFRRYEVVRDDCKIESGDSVLDWGCGTGDLYWYLHDHGVDVKYLGVDVVPEMIRLAQENKVPDARLHNVLEHPFPPKTFDHVICIGTVGAMAEPVEQRWNLVKGMFSVGMTTARKSMAITFLTDRDGAKEDDGYHWYQEFSLLMMRIGAHVPNKFGMVVRADYHPHDVTVILRHNSY
jgi:SAM-dependent methyltransferase